MLLGIHQHTAPTAILLDLCVKASVIPAQIYGSKQVSMVWDRIAKPRCEGISNFGACKRDQNGYDMHVITINKY